MRNVIEGLSKWQKKFSPLPSLHLAVFSHLHVISWYFQVVSFSLYFHLSSFLASGLSQSPLFLFSHPPHLSSFVTFLVSVSHTKQSTSPFFPWQVTNLVLGKAVHSQTTLTSACTGTSNLCIHTHTYTLAGDTCTRAALRHIHASLGGSQGELITWNCTSKTKQPRDYKQTSSYIKHKHIFAVIG